MPTMKPMTVEQEMDLGRLSEGLRLLRIPEHMHDAITLYVLHRIGPGDFLTAVLENDLMEAVGRADDKNQAALVSWAQLLYNYVPAACQGSPEKVQAWLDGREA